MPVIGGKVTGLREMTSRPQTQLAKRWVMDIPLLKGGAPI